MIQLVFFLSVFIVFFAYIGYPLSLYVIGLWRHRESLRGNHFPNVTIVITAHNEAKTIREKIENTLAITYPRDKLQIIIASDGSTDGTDDIISGYGHRGIELVSIGLRGGKEKAQKEAVKRSRGDILVFTDVSTMIEPRGIERIVSSFADPGIGCVSSEDRVIGKKGEASGEGFYVRYEMWLRRLESRVNSLVGLSGSFFAARKSACMDFSDDMDSDFQTLLNSVKSGLRGVSDPEAIGYYRDISDPKREFDRKIRIVLRGMTVFFRNREFLNISRYGMFSYQFFCHKLLRWLVPLFLGTLFVSNLVLAADSIPYLVVLLLQLLLALVALLTRTGMISSDSRFVAIPHYFLAVNASIIIAWYRYFRRERIVTWKPTER